MCSPFLILLVCSGYQESKIWSDNEGNENEIFWEYVKNIHILQLWLSEKAYCSIYMFVCF